MHAFNPCTSGAVQHMQRHKNPWAANLTQHPASILPCGSAYLQEGQVSSTPRCCHQCERIMLDLLLWQHTAAQQRTAAATSASTAQRAAPSQSRTTLWWYASRPQAMRCCKHGWSCAVHDHTGSMQVSVLPAKRFSYKHCGYCQDCGREPQDTHPRNGSSLESSASVGVRMCGM
jgi:hypothetical protein